MFIHPFSDGNGRVGRLWQSVILADLHPVFEYLPIESLIKDKQKDYYRVLEVCDAEGESTQFIQLMLAVILESLNELKSEVVVETQTPDSRLTFARGVFSATSFSRKDYMQLHKSIATATASRDLKHGVDGGILRKKGARALTSYQFTDV